MKRFLKNLVLTLVGLTFFLTASIGSFAPSTKSFSGIDKAWAGSKGKKQPAVKKTTKRKKGAVKKAKSKKGQNKKGKKGKSKKKTS